MGGVYGSFLDFFPELLEVQGFYTQEPTVAGGYQNRQDIGEFAVVYQNDEFQRLTNKSGKWNGLDIKDGILLWSSERLPVGAFFENPHKENAVYRIEGVIDYQREGGFYHYVAGRAAGANGSQTERLELKRGVF
jgi:hypothetical protein